MKHVLMMFAISVVASCGGGETADSSGSTDNGTEQIETTIQGLTTPSKVSIVTAN